MDGLADNPWPWFACGLAAFLFAAWWAQRTGSRSALLAAAGMLALALIPLLTSMFRDTPTKQVAKALESLRGAAERRDVDGVLRGVSEQFKAGAFDRKTLDGVMRREFAHYTPNHVSFGSPATSFDGDRATAKLEISTSGEYRSGIGPMAVPLYRMRFELVFRKEGDAWKLVGAKRFSWQGEPPAEIPLDQKQ